jgi:hypothetical protein
MLPARALFTVDKIQCMITKASDVFSAVSTTRNISCKKDCPFLRVFEDDRDYFNV